MASLISSIEDAFASIDSKLATMRTDISSIDEYFNARLEKLDHESAESLNRARDEMIERIRVDQTQLLARAESTPHQLAKFTLSNLDWSESSLLNYDEINTHGCHPSLLNLVRFSHLYRLHLHEIEFVERQFDFNTNFMSILSNNKIFIDVNMTREEGELVLYKRMLIIFDAQGRKLHELNYRPIDENHDTNTVPYVAKNRIYIFSSHETDLNAYHVDVFNFRLELERTVSLSKDIRHLIKSTNELCVQTTTNLRFYDLDLNFKCALGQRDDSQGDFFVSNLRLTAFNSTTLCLFSFHVSQLVFMSRASGQVLSRSNLNRTVFDYLSLFDLRQDQMLFVSKFFRTQPKQTAMVINSNGQVLIEKVLEFFFSEIARTAYGTIILNRGLFRNNQHTQTIRFKTL